jgi:hypothetical protein
VIINSNGIIMISTALFFQNKYIDFCLNSDDADNATEMEENSSQNFPDVNTINTDRVKFKEENEVAEKYIELIRRAPQIESRMAEIREEELLQGAIEIQNLSTEDNWWKSETCFQENFPYYALFAVKQGIITVTNFANIICYWAGIQDRKKFDWEIFPITLYDPENPQKVNPLLAKELEIQSAYNDHFSQQEIESALLNATKKGNAFDKTLFIVSISYKVYLLKQDMLFALRFEGPKYSIMSLATKRIRPGEPPVGTWKKIPYLMLPSFTLFNALLQQKFECPSYPNPVLGISKLADIRRNGKVYTRDCALPFPDLFFREADSISCDTLISFTVHDLYHSYRASTAGVQTKAFIKVAKIIRKHATTLEKKDRPPLWHLACRIEDMEIRHYIYTNKTKNYLLTEDIKTPSFLFLVGLADFVCRAKSIHPNLIVPYDEIMQVINKNQAKWRTFGISLTNIVNDMRTLHLSDHSPNIEHTNMPFILALRNSAIKYLDRG